ncbi:MAG: glycosyltransferase family 9 protein [Alphaproteobacteria bacterium]|nr:glycosyltransferase family 9 protein [Alphaproteobacteria bacterium]
MNILFITCSRIGDAVLTTGILKFIEHAFPGAKVTIAVDPLPAPLFKDYPLLDRLIVFPKKKHSRHWVDLWMQTVARKWDWVIDCRGSVVSYGLWAKKRSLWHSTPGDTRHKVEQISGMAGIPTTSTHLWFSACRQEKAKALLPDDHPYLAMAPAANWIGKQWPIEFFTDLAGQFITTYPSAKIAIFAAPHEQAMVQPLLNQLPSHACVDFIKNPLDLADVAACIQRCRVFIGNDSGLMHIAAAVKTPTIGLFGPSREENYGPWQSPNEDLHRVVRIPLSYEQLAQTPGFSHKCQTCFMTSLTTEKVWLSLRDRWDFSTLS